jgi:hypothetical protein
MHCFSHIRRKLFQKIFSNLFLNARNQAKLSNCAILQTDIMLDRLNRHWNILPAVPGFGLRVRQPFVEGDTGLPILIDAGPIVRAGLALAGYPMPPVAGDPRFPVHRPIPSTDTAAVITHNEFSLTV